MTNTWLPERQRRDRATTAYRYGLMIERSIAPTVGHYAISAITATRLPVHFVWGLADDVFDAQAGGGTGPSAA